MKTSFEEAHVAPQRLSHLAYSSRLVSSSGPACFSIWVTVKTTPHDQHLGAFIKKGKDREFLLFLSRSLDLLLLGSSGSPTQHSPTCPQASPQNLCTRGQVQFHGRTAHALTKALHSAGPLTQSKALPLSS